MAARKLLALPQPPTAVFARSADRELPSGDWLCSVCSHQFLTKRELQMHQGLLEVQSLEHLSFGARAPQEADAFFCFVVHILSFVIAECIHKFERIERSTNAC